MILSIRSDFIMFLDSDDWLEYNACEVAYNYIKRHDFDIVAFNYYIYFEKNGQFKLKDYKNKSIFSTCLTPFSSADAAYTT